MGSIMSWYSSLVIFPEARKPSVLGGRSVTGSITLLSLDPPDRADPEVRIRSHRLTSAIRRSTKRT
jgi:hypothetical protein